MRAILALLPLLGCVTADATEGSKPDVAPAAASTEVQKAEVGAPAPDFALPDLDGKTHRLSDHRGKVVVLEWFNPGCPYVADGYSEGGALTGRAAKAAEQGVVWLTINSGAPGKQGHGVEVNRRAAATWTMPQPLLLDEAGDVGRRYGAVTTPHMYVIDADGVLRYEGGIDNAPMRRHEGEYRPYAERALEDVLAGREVRTPRSKPYGCSVKYGS